jgi:hypothetical protein
LNSTAIETGRVSQFSPSTTYALWRDEFDRSAALAFERQSPEQKAWQAEQVTRWLGEMEEFLAHQAALRANEQPSPEPTDPPQPEQPQQRRRQRRPTLASVSKQASKAGIAVARYEIKPDGTFVVIIGESESTEPNPWLAELRREQRQ